MEGQSRRMRPVEYPLLGEPPVVEFVNTLYIDPDGVVDFLATVDLARGWFSAVDPTILTDLTRLNENARAAFVDLRDAVRTVFDATDDTDLDSAVGVLESAANASCGQLILQRSARNQLTCSTTFDTTGPAGALSLLVHAAITIATTPDAGGVLVCDRPACNMRYFQHHRRRRYCNPACANSDRQSRFQQRHQNRADHD